MLTAAFTRRRREASHRLRRPGGNGHGDAMGGAVIGSGELIQRIKSEAMVDVGGVISPVNAWLIMRGSVTLPLRMRQHTESAQRVAEFLASDPRVAYVAYPGLPATRNTIWPAGSSRTASAACSPSPWPVTRPRRTGSSPRCGSSPRQCRSAMTRA